MEERKKQLSLKLHKYWEDWAIDTALKQRYALILKEMDRRNAFYERVQNIEHLRLFVTVVTIVLGTIILLYSY